MSKVKSARSGQVATLLTLGLVLVGAVVSLGISYFTNNNKLATSSRAAINCNGPYTCANGKSYWYRPGNGTYHCNSDCACEIDKDTYCEPSNPAPTQSPAPTQGGGGNGGGTVCGYTNLRSCQQYHETGCTTDGCSGTTAKYVAGGGGGGSPTATPTPIPGSGCTTSFTRACCFEKNGKTQIYATAQARNANQMCAPCTSDPPPNGYGTAYGATHWFECDDKKCVGKSYDECMKLQSPPSTTYTCTSNIGKCVPKISSTESAANTCKQGVGTSSKPLNYTCKGGNSAVCCSIAGTTPSRSPTNGSTTLTPTKSQTQTPNLSPTPTLNPSRNCTNQECASPNLGVWYSYRCAGMPQVIGGVTQCPVYDIYQGKNCASFFKNLVNINAVESDYCNAPYTGVAAKRNITIKYTISQTGAINIDPDNQTMTFDITNNYGLRLFSRSFTFGQLPFNDIPITVNTGTNLVYGYVYYHDLKNRATNVLTTLSSSPANVVDGQANITINIR